MDPHRYRVDPRMILPVILSMILGVFLIFMEATSQRVWLFVLLLLPFYYLGAEILARKIVFDAQGIIVLKLFRSVRIDWSDVSSLDAIRSGNKLFVIIQGEGNRPLLITNTIAPFNDLVDRLLESVPRETIAPGAKALFSNPPSKHGPLIQAWITCTVLTALVAGKMLGYG